MEIQDLKNILTGSGFKVFDDVLEQAKVADTMIAKGESYPLLGIPLAVKDNILIKGEEVTAASKILEGYKATYDATIITKLKQLSIQSVSNLTVSLSLTLT